MLYISGLTQFLSPVVIEDIYLKDNWLLDIQMQFTLQLLAALVDTLWM